MLVAEHESLVIHVEKFFGKECHSDVEGCDRLLDLLYGEPLRTSSGPSFYGGASPIPIPIPAPASPISGANVRLPSSSESSSDKENSAPGSQQSVVTELVAIVEKNTLDVNEESSHVLGHLVQCKMVCSILGQRCRSKAHPLCCDCRSTLFLG